MASILWFHLWKRSGMLAASMGSCHVLYVVKMRLMFFAAYRTAPLRNDVATDGERAEDVSKAQEPVWLPG